MNDLREIVCAAGIMPVLFAEEDCARRVVDAIEATEVPVVEILQRGETAKSVLKEACRIKKSAYVGAGTVCTLEQCKEMVDLGADFIVSPGYNRERVEWCVKNGVTVIPGVSSTSEVMEAVGTGLRSSRRFPLMSLAASDILMRLRGRSPTFNSLSRVVLTIATFRSFPIRV